MWTRWRLDIERRGRRIFELALREPSALRDEIANREQAGRREAEALADESANREQAGRRELEGMGVESVNRETARHREAEALSVETEPREGETLQQWRFSHRFECKNCHIKYEEPEPPLFSFNNPFGACPRCQGFGNTIDFDLNLVIPDVTKTLGEGAIEPFTKPKYRSRGRRSCESLRGRLECRLMCRGRT